MYQAVRLNSPPPPTPTHPFLKKKSLLLGEPVVLGDPEKNLCDAYRTPNVFVYGKR